MLAFLSNDLIMNNSNTGFLLPTNTHTHYIMVLKEKREMEGPYLFWEAKSS